MKQKALHLGLIALLLFTALGLTGTVFAQERAKIECQVCYNLNDPGNKYCIYCGQKLREEKDEGVLILEPGVSRSFHLKDGNVIRGTVQSTLGDSLVVIETTNGDLTIPTSNILSERVDIQKYDGTRFIGPLIHENEYEVTVLTSYGRVKVQKLEIKNMQRYMGDRALAWTEEKEQFVPVEEITDVFMDPTAFPLHPHSLYLSGLSVGYGFSNTFMLRTRFGNDLVGDLNLQPFFRVFHSSSQTTELSIGVGAELYNRHPIKLETARYSHWIINNSTGERLEEDNEENMKAVLVDHSERQFYSSVFVVMSRRSYLPSGRGRWGWHLGLRSSTFILDKPALNPQYRWDSTFQVPYRAWFAMDYDLLKNLKFLIEMFVDNGHKYVSFGETVSSYFDDTPFVVDTMKGDYQPVDFDFGAIYSVSEKFRIGLHFQSPFIAIYWKW